MTENSVRPTKKQRELLTYIERFIQEHRYSPSYREIMNGQGYTSVATVSLHVNSLIRRGHLRKRDRSARSLEVVKDTAAPAASTANNAAGPEAQWLAGRIRELIRAAESSAQPPADDIATLLRAMEILGYESAADALRPRLAKLEARRKTG